MDLHSQLALLCIGFTLFSSLILVFAHLLGPAYNGLRPARWLGILLLLNLSALQLFHFAALADGLIVWSNAFYVCLLFLTAPLFFFFCRAIIRPDNGYPPWVILLAVPPILGLLLPNQTMFFAAFFIGSLYFSVLAYELFLARNQRQRFLVEMSALLVIFIIAGMTLLLGLMMPFISHALFVSSYAMLVALAFLPAMYMVVRFDDIVSIAEEASRMAYASSTLGSVNIERKLQVLESLMVTEQLYMNDKLNLGRLAEQLELSTHQTSELLNSHLGLSFPAYLRKLRVAEACRQLLEEPDASVLSIGLAVGFTSQSAFYTAFKEVTGKTPGQYRDADAAS